MRFAFLVSMALLILTSCGGGGGGSTTDPVDSSDATNAAIENAKAEISALMKEPESTTFRNISTYRIGSDDTVCGEYNAKNSFGGYVGYKAFSYRPNTNSLFQFVTETDDWQFKTATETLMDTVCSDVSKEVVDAAQNTFIQSIF